MAKNQQTKNFVEKKSTTVLCSAKKIEANQALF